jgi:hypothetical protein
LRADTKQVVYYEKAEDFLAVFESPSKIIHTVDVIGLDNEQQRVRVSFSDAETHVEACSGSNEVIASFITAYARIVLHKKMKVLGSRLIYVDTDSLIFELDPDEICPIEEGYFLGEFKSELAPDEYITRICAISPKSYCYTTNKNRNLIKFKGFFFKQHCCTG